MLFVYADHANDPDAAGAARELVVVRRDQREFNEVVAACLQRVEFDADGYARLIHLPAYAVADVVGDPNRSLGPPVFARGGGPAGGRAGVAFTPTSPSTSSPRRPGALPRRLRRAVAGRAPGPFLYAVTRTGLHRVLLDP